MIRVLCCDVMWHVFVFSHLTALLCRCIADINDIKRFCMDVLKEEVTSEAGKMSCDYVSGKPDIVVVLFGINDLKHLLADLFSHPFKSRSKGKGSDGGIIHKFRHGMDALLNEIHSYAPNAIVV